jgi:hypothetical protein
MTAGPAASLLRDRDCQKEAGRNDWESPKEPVWLHALDALVKRGGPN